MSKEKTENPFEKTKKFSEKIGASIYQGDSDKKKKFTSEVPEITLPCRGMPLSNFAQISGQVVKDKGLYRYSNEIGRASCRERVCMFV